MRNKKHFAAGAVLLSAALCLSSFAPAFAEEAEDEAPGIGIVETAYGLAEGVPGDEYEEVTLFKGVPYAAAPVGDLRWKAPEDPESWDDVRVFDTYADAAMQWPGDMDSEPWKTDFYYDELPTFSEDCLYLNIATPATSGDENLPVYMWYHGGGLNHGYSYEVECDPEALAAKGVVVVEVGTRLGVFGYMALPQLDEESDYGASGNYGLMDTIKAIEWVKENIAAFGGDPDNITLGGQSGGTRKTAAVFASEAGSELVNNVIWETGVMYDLGFTPLEDLEDQSIAWLQTCGLTGEESLDELREMDASVFMGEEDIYGQAPQAMCVDGVYVQYNSILEAYEDGMLEGINILAGTNLGEHTEVSIGENVLTADDFYDFYKDLLGDLYDEYDFENLVEVTDDNATAVARALYSVGFSRTMRENVTAVELIGQATDETDEAGDVYVYLLSHVAPGRDDDYWWAWHSSDLWYAFGSLRDIPEQRDWEDWDYELADIMTSYWTNFMKTGDPNGEGLPEWLPSNSEQLAFMNLGEEDTLECVTDVGALEDLMIAYCQATFNYSE